MSKLSSFSKKEIMNLLPDSLVVAGRVWQRVCPRNLVRSVEMFLVGPSLSESVVLLSTFLPSCLSVRSRSEQCLSMVCKAVAWSFIEEEKTERSSANRFTLCVFECLVLVVVTVEGGGRGLERYYLPFPGAGNQLISKRLNVSSIFPL